MSYRWDAADYARHAASQQAWGRALVERLALTGGERVLDVGCGNGVLSAHIAARVPRGAVLGVDSSPEMIELAVATHPPATHPNLSFQVQDASDLRVDAPVDAVLSNAALHWVWDHRPVLSGIHRALRPGGRVVLSFGGKGNAEAALAVLFQAIASGPWARHFEDFPFPYYFPGPEDYGKLVEASGLIAERLELVPRDMAVAGTEGMAGWIRTTWQPYTGQVPEGERDAFIRAVAEAYVRAHPPDGNGIVHTGMMRLELLARRPG